MFVVIYKFEVKSGQEEVFIHHWEELTKLIYQYEGSLGSKLHKSTSGEYLAYAQWPCETSWENAGGHLPDDAGIHRNKMREACERVETIHTMNVVSDLTKGVQYKRGEK